jgi:urease accessory protein
MSLLLADARLPTGAHVHSGGVEQAVDDGVVFDNYSLESFVRGRLLTAGRLSAHVAAQSCLLAGGPTPPAPNEWCLLDREVSARILSPALRSTSRRQGRSLLRTGMALFGPTVLSVLDTATPDGPHLAVGQGALAGVAGLGPFDAALVAAYGTVTSSASAALRLLGLDPMAVARLEAGLAPLLDEVAGEAARAGHAGPRHLPSPAAPLSDLLGERHGARKERLFAS